MIYLSVACNVGWAQLNNKCYKYFPNKTIWSASKSNCESLGSNLVAIHSREENNFARLLVSADSWLGGNDLDSEGSWAWEDREDWGGFLSWSLAEPNNSGGNEDCVVMTSSDNWNDIPCTVLRSYVCKK